ncbi:MAG: trehalose-phosphatase [Candidatus Rokubacteria bacterium]|nr:trehalose-phosphatase [Candidatus Rokubacteria bacterium]
MSLPSGLLERLEKELGRGQDLVVLLDYDGTLTPIVPSPGAAILAGSARRTLAGLAASPRARLAILSGRALGDLKTRVGLRNVIYGGCHGLVIEGGRLRFRHPRARPAVMRDARRLLAAAAPAIPGAELEVKGLALSLHYRHVPPGRRREVRALVERVRRGVRGVTVVAGRDVFDFVPRVAWDKGRAARWIVARAALRPGPAVLYAGDDATDEAAFRALRGRGITVRVGGSPTAAEFRVPGVREVHALLRRIQRALE